MASIYSVTEAMTAVSARGGDDDMGRGEVIMIEIMVDMAASDSDEYLSPVRMRVRVVTLGDSLRRRCHAVGHSGTRVKEDGQRLTGYTI